MSVIPGLGHVYLGQSLRGAGFFLFWAVCIVVVAGIMSVGRADRGPAQFLNLVCLFAYAGMVCVHLRVFFDVVKPGSFCVSREEMLAFAVPVSVVLCMVYILVGSIWIPLL